MPALLLLLLAAPSSALPWPRAVKVISWNMGRPYLGGHTESRARDSDLPLAARLIRAEKPDLVCLFELRDTQVDKLAALLAPDYQVRLLANTGGDRHPGILLVAGSMTSVLDFKGHKMPFGKLANGTEVLCVHTSFFDRQANHDQVDALTKWVAARPGPLVLAGDFNLVPTSSEYGMLANVLTEASLGVGPTTIYGGQLDYVWVKSDPLPRCAARQHPGAIGPGMDHRPIGVDMAW